MYVALSRIGHIKNMFHIGIIIVRKRISDTKKIKSIGNCTRQGNQRGHLD